MWMEKHHLQQQITFLTVYLSVVFFICSFLCYFDTRGHSHTKWQQRQPYKMGWETRGGISLTWPIPNKCNVCPPLWGVLHWTHFSPGTQFAWVTVTVNVIQVDTRRTLSCTVKFFTLWICLRVLCCTIVLKNVLFVWVFILCVWTTLCACVFGVQKMTLGYQIWS